MQVVTANHYSEKMLLKIARLRNIMRTAWHISKAQNMPFRKALKKAWERDRKLNHSQFSLF